MPPQISQDREVRFQRARGTLNISAASAAGDQSRLTNLRQQGSYRAIFPRPIKGTIDAVIINTAGGITGGDSRELILVGESRWVSTAETVEC